MDDVRILVGIVTRNRASILPKALKSASAQAAPNIDIAVVDDCSSDGTRALATAWPRVDWKFRDKPDGYMSARNDFMSRAGYDYFVSLDDDSWFLRGDEISEALKLFEHDPAVAAVAYDIVSPDQPSLRERAHPRPVNTFIGCGHMLRLSSVRVVGGYDPAPGGYGGEEKDLSLRLMDEGMKVVLMPGFHVWHDKTMVARDLASQHKSGVCNDLTMTVRRAPWYLLPIMLPAKVFRHLMFGSRKGMMSGGR